MGKMQDVQREECGHDDQSPSGSWSGRLRGVADELRRRGSVLDNRQFEAQYLNCHRRLFRFIVGLVHNDVEAQDIMSDTVITAFTNRSRFLVTAGTFESWLLGIAWRKAMRHLKRNRRRWAPGDVTDHGAVDPGLNPLEQVTAREDAFLVATYLNQLKPKYRIAMQLHYGQGLGMSEIAAIQRTTERNVRVRLMRGRAHLIDRLRDHVGRDTLSPQARRALADLLAEAGGWKIVQGNGGRGGSDRRDP